MRRELDQGAHPNYTEDLRRAYEGRLPGGVDLVTYWFDKSRNQVELKQHLRVGLLATQGIRGGLNRTVLSRISEQADIFWAWSDRNWTLDGAAVHVSMIAFTGKTHGQKFLNGIPVDCIYPNLSATVEITSSSLLRENRGLSFIGDQKGGKFDLVASDAEKLLRYPLNPNGRPNSDVIKPWVNGTDLTSRPRGAYIVDFGVDVKEEKAALYEGPFEYVRKLVYPSRQNTRREIRKRNWWLHHEPMPAMRFAIKPLKRFIATPRVSKHRLFVWVPSSTLADSAVVAIAREDDYFLGILQSKVHELWARAQGTQLREVESGFRYTPNSTFDTFPFPWPPGTEPSEADSRVLRAIADAARELVRLRDAWLNPPGASEADLKDRTLTKLYNKRPEWLRNAHRALDRAVFAAYGWPEDPEHLPDQDLLARLLALNHERAAAQTSTTPKLKAKRRTAKGSSPEPL